MDFDAIEMVAVVIGSGGLGTVLPVLINGARAHATGKAQTERSLNADLSLQRDDAYAHLAAERLACNGREAILRMSIEEAEAGEDHAFAHARTALEYAAWLRRLLREAGTVPPDWPPCPRCATPLDRIGA